MRNLNPSQPPKPTFPQISLRLFLVVPFIIQIFVAVGVTGYLSFRHGQKAVNNLANQLQSQVNDRIMERLKNYLAIPPLINQININATQAGRINLPEQMRLERYLWQQMETFPSVYSIYVGSQKGSIIGINRDNDGNLISKISEDFPKRSFYLLNSQGNRSKLVRVQPNYDSRTRPWFIKAKAKKKPIWSDIYQFAFDKDEPMLGITAAQPIYNEEERFQGVYAVDLSLSFISEFLHKLRLSPSSRILIIERSGLLVAGSSVQKPFTVDAKTKEIQRLNINNINDD
ncbi:MAG: cache domain-containing protein, partial [Cyanobacteria bacterium P01_G01_bin.49]